MAKPRIFISSTFYDLKHIRSSLETFVETMGFEPILSEKGNIAYSPDVPLDESCYRETASCDVFVLIIGGRYGSAANDEGPEIPKNFYKRYESITKREYEAAISRDIPIYILIDRSVYIEYETFQRNREQSKVQYAHVDSINIFHLIDDILKQPRNNPVHQFERHSDIESWLREQWAGLFREMIVNRSGQKQLNSLSEQVTELANVTTTLKRYLEEVMSKMTGQEDMKAIIKDEKQRLEESRKMREFANTSIVKEFEETIQISIEKMKDLFTKAITIEDFLNRLGKINESYNEKERILEFWKNEGSWVIGGINDGRKILGLPSLEFEENSKKSTRKKISKK